MTDNFDLASARARLVARELVEDGIPAAIVADSFLTQGLAAWTAETGRQTSASTLLAIWAKVRDAVR